MTSCTGISPSARVRVAPAMQMSRAVITPMTCPRSSVTGTAPQSSSHIILAASARLVSGPHDFTSDVISSFTFMPVLLHGVDTFGVARHMPMKDTEAAGGEYRRRADDVKLTQTDVDPGGARSTIGYSRHARRTGGTDEKTDGVRIRDPG